LNFGERIFLNKIKYSFRYKNRNVSIRRLFQATNHITKMKLVLVSLLLIQLFSFSIQGIPSINCGVANVLEEGFELQTNEDCDDKFVCELKCSKFKDFKNCKHDSFLDLTDLLKKDINYKIAYNKACKNGLLTGEYLNEPVSLKFREFIEFITQVKQETYFQTETKKYIPFASKYPGLYKESIEKIRELPEFKNAKDKTPMNAMIKFEDMYMQFAIQGKSENIQHTAYGLYFFYKGLMGVKNNCEKKFRAMKDKSRVAVTTMITEAINKQIAESVAESKESNHRIRDGFAGFHLYFNKVQADAKNRQMFQHNSNVLYSVYANRLADALIAGNFTTGRFYCGCDRIESLQSLMNAGIQNEDFSVGFSLNPFIQFLHSTCQTKCSPVVEKNPEIKVEPVKEHVKKIEVKPVVKKIEPIKKKQEIKIVEKTKPVKKEPLEVKKEKNIGNKKENFKKEVKELIELKKKKESDSDDESDESDEESEESEDD
jgi:hypothetical protein